MTSRAHQPKGRLNTALLYTDDNQTRILLVKEILAYVYDNLSLMGSRYTRNDFIQLSRYVLDLEYRRKVPNAADPENWPLLGFSALSGIIKHLKALQKMPEAHTRNYSLLRLLYIPDGAPTR